MATPTTTECPTCSGTGWRTTPGVAGVVPCECRTRTRLERALAAAQIPNRYQHCTFPEFDCRFPDPSQKNPVLWNAFSITQSYMQDYPLVEGKGLLLVGPPGVGKTHLAVALLKALIEKGAEGLFVDYQELLQRIRSSYNPTSLTAESQITLPVQQAELLVLDDLGANRISDWVEDTIHYILNHRYNEKKPTIITSNLAFTTMAGEEGKRVTRPTFQERLGIRVASRLHEMCRIVEMPSDFDYRKRGR